MLSQNKCSLSLYTFLFCIHQCHVSSSFYSFYLARCSFRFFPNFRWDALWGVTRGYKDGLQPESLADGNWLVCHAKSVAWTNRVIFSGFIMWATVLWLFGCLASLDGPLVTNSLFSQTCLSTISSWALLEPSIPSRVERVETLNTSLWGGFWQDTDVQRYGSYLQSMLKLVPWFVVTGETKSTSVGNLKLINLTQTWGVCMSLDSGMH